MCIRDRVTADHENKIVIVVTKEGYRFEVTIEDGLAEEDWRAWAVSYTHLGQTEQ